MAPALDPNEEVSQRRHPPRLLVEGTCSLHTASRKLQRKSPSHCLVLQDLPRAFLKTTILICPRSNAQLDPPLKNALVDWGEERTIVLHTSSPMPASSRGVIAVRSRG